MIPAAWIAYGLAVALATWGPSPPCRHMTIRYENLHGLLDGYADPSRCRIVLDADPWTPWTRSRVCKTLVHEKGHLYGKRHSSDPRSIMYPRLHYWRPCET